MFSLFDNKICDNFHDIVIKIAYYKRMDTQS